MIVDGEIASSLLGRGATIMTIAGWEVASLLLSLVLIPTVEHPTSPIAPGKTSGGDASSAEVVTAIRFPPKPLSSWSLSPGILTSFLNRLEGEGPNNQHEVEAIL